MMIKLESIPHLEWSNRDPVMNQAQSFAFLNQTTQARRKLKRKRLEVQVKGLLEPVALNGLIAIEELLV